MFGSLFRIGMLATLVGGSTFALVGPDRIKAYFHDGKEKLLSAIDEAQGMESKLGMIREQIKGLDDEARRLKKEAITRRVESERLREEVANREAALDQRARVLETVSNLLDRGQPSYAIGRVTFTRAEVEQDAAEKLSLYNVQQETLKSLRETLATKEKAQAIAEENVGRAEALRAELLSKVGLLEAQLQKYRAKETFAATVEEVIDTSDLDSDLARARELIQEFESDLEVRARMLDERLNGTSEQPRGGIDYEALERGNDTDLVGRIRTALQGDAVSVTGPAEMPAVLDVPAVH